MGDYIYKPFVAQIIISMMLAFEVKATVPELFISEYAEGSGNSKAIEIYNGTGVSVDLESGAYKIEMYFNGSITSGLTITLKGKIVNNDVFVIATAAAVLPVSPDQTSNASWYNGNDVIVLKKDTVVIDVIGQVGFNPGTAWGTGNTSTADNTIRRKPKICRGKGDIAAVFDPEQEWDGFGLNEFTGLGTHFPDCSLISSLSITPASLYFSGQIGSPSAVQSYTLKGLSLTSDITVMCPEPFEISVNPAGSFGSGLTINLADAMAGKTLYIRYSPPVSGPHSGEVTHTGALVSASVAIQGNTPSSVPVYAIQGTAAASGYDGSIVITEGLVTGDFQGAKQLKGFYIQDTIGDGDPLSSDGIFIFNTSFNVDQGDYVKIKGEVDEFNELTEIKNVLELEVLAKGKAISPLTVTLPVSDINSFEKWEGMLLLFPDSLMVTENFNLGRFGELTLSSGGRIMNPTNYLDPNDDPASGTSSDGTSNVAAVLTQQALDLRRSILLDDASGVQNPFPVPYLDPLNTTLRIGSTVSDLTGIMDFAFGTYRIQPTRHPAFNYAKRPALPSVGMHAIKIASFNVLNYFNGDGSGGGFPTSRGASTLSEFKRQRTKIIEALKQINADIVGIIEMENDGDDAPSAIADLVNGLNATGGETYAYISDPVYPYGSLGTDAIKQAIIYNTKRVSPFGLSMTDTNDAFTTNGFSRRPLAQSFTVKENGEKFSIIVNHLKSKSCAEATLSDLDQNDGQSCYNERRKRQVMRLLKFITEVEAQAGDADIILVGDLNAYEEEDPIDMLRAAGLIKLASDGYSFVFFGNAGSLDHAFVNPEFASSITGAKKWHINADEPRIKDYNQEFNPAYLYTEDAYRSSDHDPLIIGLKLKSNTSLEDKGNQPTTGASIRLTPNPAIISSVVNLEIINLINEKVRVVVTDIAGRILFNEQIYVCVPHFNKRLDIGHVWKQGTYIVTVIVRTTSLTGKLIIR